MFNVSAHVLVAHATITLPDSIEQRKQVLEAILDVAPNHPHAQEYREMLGHLNRQSLMQRELIALTEKGSK